MIIAGIILITAATMVATDNLWRMSWARMKTSLVLGIIGGGLIAAGMMVEPQNTQNTQNPITTYQARSTTH